MGIRDWRDDNTASATATASAAATTMTSKEGRGMQEEDASTYYA